LNAIARHVADWPQAAMLVPSLPGASLWLLTVGGLWFCLCAALAIGRTAGGDRGPAARTAAGADLLMSEDGRVLACAMPRAWSILPRPAPTASSARLGAAQRPGRRQALDGECPTSKPPASVAAPGFAAGARARGASRW